MLSPIFCCAQCGDEYDPIEGEYPSTDEPSFCSGDCEDEYNRQLDNDLAYELGYTQGASVY